MVAPPFLLHYVATRLPRYRATRLRNYRTIRLSRCHKIAFEETPSYQMITFLILLLILFLIHLDSRYGNLVYVSMCLQSYRATLLHAY